jgi:glutamyl-tRNA reductase
MPNAAFTAAPHTGSVCAVSVETADPLTVVHRPGRSSPGARPAPFPAWTVATCQRALTIAFGHERSAAWADAQPPGAEVRHGVEAYRLLLEITTGLRSAIAGETNVAGQMRLAWHQFEADPAQAELVTRLTPTVRQLFSDAAIVRQRWLQGLGGTSYGSLARRLLGCLKGARVLIVGGGELARSIVPAFRDRQVVALFTRTAHGGHAVQEPVAHRFVRGEEPAAIAWAHHIVLCVPPDSDFDATWIAALRERRDLPVLHLGARHAEVSAWRDAGIALATLDDLYALAARLGSARERRLDAARAACAEMAAAFGAGATPQLAPLRAFA